MNEAQAQAEQIEIEIEQAEQSVALLNSLKRLKANKDFQLIVEEIYLKQEPVRLVYLKSSLNPKVDQEAVDSDIKAIGSFANFINSIIRGGEMSESLIADSKAELEHIEEDELEDEVSY